MGKGSGGSRSLFRLLFWEGLAFLGLLHMLHTPNANVLWSKHFYYNALFFLAAYPFLYVYRWKLGEGLFRFILWPAAFLLNWLLAASAYLWLTYCLLYAGSPYSGALMGHWAVLGCLFLFIYFPLVQPLWGVGKDYFGLSVLARIFLFAGLGGFLAFLLGKFVDGHFGVSMGQNRFLLWLSLILIGTAVGALAARKKGKA